MSVYVVIKDETLNGQIMQELRIALASELTTVRALITARVREEVEGYNQAGSARLGLVQPTAAEQLLNGNKQRRAPVDADKQIEVALAAFARNGFFVLVDDEQCEDLDQEVLIKPATTVTFIKLTPLVGG